MEKRLHGHLLREVREHHDAVVSTLVGAGIAKRRHTVREVVKTIKALDARTCSSVSGRLADGVHTHPLLTSIDVTERTCDRLQQRLGISHIVITEECAVTCHVCQSQHTRILIQRIQFLSHLQHLVERNGRDVERLVQETIVKIIISALLSHVGTHGTGVEHKVNLATQRLLSLREKHLQVFHTGSICCNHSCISLLCQFRDGTHAASNSCICKYDLCTLFHCAFCHLPGDGLIVECTKNNSLFTF